MDFFIINRVCDIMVEDLKITVLTPEFYNYGSLTIAGILKDAGYDVNLQKGFDEVIEADMVFISLHSTIHLKKYQEQINSIPIFKVIGGPVTLTPELVLKYLNVNVVVAGEGENVVLSIVKDLEEAAKERTLEKRFQSSNARIINNLNEKKPLNRPLPFIPPDISRENIRGANVYIETHRGCPGNCGFCQVPCFFGRDVRSRPLEEIINEVKEFKKRGAKRLAISGGTGSLYGSKKFRKIDEEAFIELLKRISEITGSKNLTIPDIRVDLISDSILEAIRNYTNGWVFFGIESGNDRILKRMKKGINVDDVRDAVESARKHDLKVAGSFIVGYPGEGEDEFKDTLDLADELMLDDYFISIAEPIPGTDLASEVIKIPEDENLLFLESEEYRKYDLSIAEARAFTLMLESYIFRSFPSPVTQELFTKLLKEVKSQGSHIRMVTNLIKK